MSEMLWGESRFDIVAVENDSKLFIQQKAELVDEYDSICLNSFSEKVPTLPQMHHKHR